MIYPNGHIDYLMYENGGALIGVAKVTMPPIRYKTVTATEPSEEAAKTVQTVTLYIDPSVDIPEGSKITVTQNKVTRDYERSGTPAVYTVHQEVPLELWEGWA